MINWELNFNPKEKEQEGTWILEFKASGSREALQNLYNMISSAAKNENISGEKTEIKEMYPGEFDGRLPGENWMCKKEKS